VNIRLRESGSIRRGRIPVRSRVAWLLSVYVVVSAGVIAGLLLQTRSDAIVSGEKLVSAFAQLADEQTTRTIQSIDQTLVDAEERVVAAIGAGSASQDSVGAAFRELLRDRPFLRAVWVLDERGRSIYDSDAGNVGTDFSDRAYFTDHREHLGSGFHVGVLVRSRTTDGWFIPATRSLQRRNGKFGGVVVGAVDPRFFDRAWTLENEIPDLSIALVRMASAGEDGMVLMRVPWVAGGIGASIGTSPLQSRLQSQSRGGTYRNTSPIDGAQRLFAYRRLAAYPSLVINVGLSMDEVLAAWWRMLWTLLSGWVLGSAALVGLTLWLAREWTLRRATEQRNRQLFEASPYPVCAIDRETLRFLAVNDAAVEEYGWSREEFLALPAADIYLPEDEPVVTAMRSENALGARGPIHEMRHRRKDGSLFDVETSVRPIEFDGRPAIMATAWNITERKAAEQARRTAEVQLRQSQKMEAVGQLTGGIAHDFNNILTVILANADALQEEEDLDPGLVTRLEQIAQAVQRASGLTRQLLAFSRKQPLHPQPTDINKLVATTGRLLRRALGEPIEIDSILADDLWRVNIDRAQLETALVNLCVNARDAMPGGGRLLIETRNLVLDEDYVARNPDATVGDFAMLAVTDAGTGIAPEVLAKVFEPFFTTKDVGKGTGLGLSMVYGFIKQSNGHLTIHSEVGRGTSIKLYLPRSDHMQEEAAVRESPPMPGGAERILVVEDDPQVCASVVRQLQSLGYAVDQAPDGAAGIAAFQAASRPYDLLLTDVVMPGPLNGKALASEVTRQWPDTKIVFMSGYSDDVISHHGRLDAGVLLLAKPFRTSDLAQIVRRALDGRTADRAGHKK
jgi:PAS domain S-box-containing protein